MHSMRINEIPHPTSWTDRQKAIETLRTLLAFLTNSDRMNSEQTLTSSELKPHYKALFDVWRALSLLNDGVVTPMLQPPKWNSRPPHPSNELGLMSLLV